MYNLFYLSVTRGDWLALGLVGDGGLVGVKESGTHSSVTENW